MTRSVPPRTSVVAKRVPEDVGGGVVLENGRGGDARDDVVRTSDAEALSALVEEQGGSVGGPGPAVPLREPARQRPMQLPVNGDLPDALALAGIRERDKPWEVARSGADAGLTVGGGNGGQQRASRESPSPSYWSALVPELMPPTLCPGLRRQCGREHRPLRVGEIVPPRRRYAGHEVSGRYSGLLGR